VAFSPGYDALLPFSPRLWSFFLLSPIFDIVFFSLTILDLSPGSEFAFVINPPSCVFLLYSLFLPWAAWDFFPSPLGRSFHPPTSFLTSSTFSLFLSCSSPPPRFRSLHFLFQSAFPFSPGSPIRPTFFRFLAFLFPPVMEIPLFSFLSPFRSLTILPFGPFSPFTVLLVFTPSLYGKTSSFF